MCELRWWRSDHCTLAMPCVKRVVVRATHPNPVPAEVTALSTLARWAVNIDSAWTPVSNEDVEAWKVVLRRRKPWPDDLGKYAAQYVRSEGVVASIPALPSGSFMSRGKITLIGSNGEAHGLTACLRQKLNEACAGLPAVLCSEDGDALDTIVNATRPASVNTSHIRPQFGVTDEGTQPFGKNASCEGAQDYFELWSSSTFCLMPGGDGFDRGATVQARAHGVGLYTYRKHHSVAFTRQQETRTHSPCTAYSPRIHSLHTHSSLAYTHTLHSAIHPPIHPSIHHHHRDQHHCHFSHPSTYPPVIAYASPPRFDCATSSQPTQALDVGCIPVFFSGTGRGDLLRLAFSRTYFATDQPDLWSVLLDEEALIGCSGSADEEACLPACVPSSQMGPRLLESLLANMGRVPGMREYIINSALQRAQGLRPLAGDFVSRFVSATAMAVAGGPPGPGNDGGKVDTWPVGVSSEKAVRPAGQPPCYRDDWDNCLPGFLVIGPQKTGTSALYEYLDVHPQLELNRKKELLHWGRPKGPNHGEFNCSDAFVSSYLDQFQFTVRLRNPPDERVHHSTALHITLHRTARYTALHSPPKPSLPPHLTSHLTPNHHRAVERRGWENDGRFQRHGHCMCLLSRGHTHADPPREDHRANAGSGRAGAEPLQRAICYHEFQVSCGIRNRRRR